MIGSEPLEWLLNSYLILFFISQYTSLVEGALESPTYAMITIEDINSGKFPGPPMIFKIVENYEGEIISKGTFGIATSPQKLPIPVDLIPEGSTLTITVIKDGFKESSPYVFTVTNETTLWGLLFKHTFLLVPEEKPTKTIPLATHPVRIENETYEINTKSEENVVDVFYDADISVIAIDVEGESEFNIVEVTIPKNVMDGTFYVTLDGFHIIQLEEDDLEKTAFYLHEEEDYNVLKIYFPNGEHQLGITATYVVPEFPTTQLVMVLALIVFVIFSVVLTKKRLTPLIVKK